MKELLPRYDTEPKVVYPLRVGFLASHGGTAMRGILPHFGERLKGSPGVVISNNKNSEAIKHARDLEVPLENYWIKSDEEADPYIRKILEETGINVVILSGWMRPIGQEVLSGFEGRIFNTHPSLLPKHAGLMDRAVHSAVLNSGDEVTGVTIHTVDSGYDTGAIVSQTIVPVMPGDDIETLRARVQAEEVPANIRLLEDIQYGRIILPYQAA